MRLIVFAVKFLFLGFFFIVSTLNLPLAKEGNLNLVFTEYGDWIIDVAGEVGTLTGYIVDVRWMPDESNFDADNNQDEIVIEEPKYSRVIKK